MSGVVTKIFTKRIFLYSIVLTLSLLFGCCDCVQLEAKSKFDVSMFPYSDDYKKDRKILRTFSVPIMNSSFLKLIKYEKNYSALKKEGVDINSLNAKNVTSKVKNFASTIIILPTIFVATNINIQINEKIVARETNDIISTTNKTITLDIDDKNTDTRERERLDGNRERERPDGNREHERLDGNREHERLDGNRERERPDGDREHERPGGNSLIDNITNIQLLEYIATFDDTNFIRNIGGINDSVFIARINSIKSTNALTFTTNYAKTYQFDVVDTQTTNVLYSGSATSEGQIGNISRDAINAMESYFASRLLAELANNSGDDNKSYVDFWLERKVGNITALESVDVEVDVQQVKNAWTNTAIPTFSVSSIKRTSISTNTNSSTSDKNAEFEKVVLASKSESAIFNVGDSIRFNFDIKQEGFVNIIYVAPTGKTMSLLYPNNYNIGYVANQSILSNGLYQVPTDVNNIEIIMREAGLSKVYLIYSKSESDIYDLTKFGSGGFPSIRSGLDFVWHIENILEKNMKSGNYFIEQIIIETIDGDR